MISVFKYEKDKQLDIQKLLDRSQWDFGEIQEKVHDIIYDVKRRGDAAVIDYTRQFDQVELYEGSMRVNQEEIDTAYRLVDKDLLKVIQRAIENIKAFHEKQLSRTWMDIKEGKILGQVIQSLDKVGIYVPGGRASYPSSVLMNSIPAKVAGVKKIIMTSPPNIEGSIDNLSIVAALEAGVDEIYKVGGAQAIAAMAFGTETIARVDKIVGPGNIFVTLAKKEVFGYVGIDMLAGPSEVLVIADDSANPSFVAADLMSQAEHDPLAAAILITDCEKLANEVRMEIEKQSKTLSRRNIINQSITEHGAIIVVSDILEAVDLANRIAPEHLELAIRKPFEMLGTIRNAGAVFLGHYSPEPLGDYFAGPNHVLPTNGTSRFFSPLNVDDFMKKSSIIYYSEEALKEVSQDIIMFAKAEGLTAHGNSIAVRYRGNDRR